MSNPQKLEHDFKLSHWRIIAKLMIAAIVLVLIALYLLLLVHVRQVLPGVVSFTANGYSWTFQFDHVLISRCLLGAAAVIIFGWVAVKRIHFRLNPTKTARLSIIFAAFLLTFLTAQWTYLPWTFCSIFALLCTAATDWLIRNLPPFPQGTSRIHRLVGFAWNKSSVAIRLGVLSLTVLTISIYYIHRGHPIITDAQSQVAQARLILSGHFRLMASPRFIHDVAIPNFILHTPTYAQYPPGHILLLLPFVWAGLVSNWLNVICGAVAVVFTVRMASRMHSPLAGTMAGLLLTCSPQFIVMQSSGMNHGSTTMFLVIAAWAFQEVMFYRRWNVLAAGIFCLGWAGITRPYTAFAHGIVWAPLLAWAAARRLKQHRLLFERRVFCNFFLCAAAVAVPLAIFAVYNFLTTGSAIVPGYHDTDVGSMFGFRYSKPVGWYTPHKAADNMISDILSLSTSMFGWFFSSWILLLGWLMTTRFGRRELIVAALILSQTILYRLYAWHELMLGTRFLSELIPFCAILAGVGLTRLVNRIDVNWQATVGTVIAIFCAGAALGGMSDWRTRLTYFTTKHQSVARFIRELRPLHRPVALVIPYQYNDAAGEYAFGPNPIWFVYEEHVAEARTLPELKNCRWVYLFGKI